MIDLPIHIHGRDVNNESIRVVDRASIRGFMEKHKAHLVGKVLDYGCGKQPYKDLVDPSATYLPFDRQRFPGNVSGEDVGSDVYITMGEPVLDAIMCNQMLQMVPAPQETLQAFLQALKFGGKFLITYATNWNEVEPWDHWRFTRGGMEELLKRCTYPEFERIAGKRVGWKILDHQRRCQIDMGGFTIPIGGGILAEKVHV